MSNPWKKAKGAGKERTREDHGHVGQLSGKTYRKASGHAAKTNEINGGIVTKVPIARYEEADSPEQAGIRKLLQQDLDALSAAAEKKSTSKRKLDAKDRGGSSADNQVNLGGSSSATTNAQTTPRFNSKGKPMPEASPEDLLTGDRDGTERKSFLVSPLSYGRTANRERKPRT